MPSMTIQMKGLCVQLTQLHAANVQQRGVAVNAESRLQQTQVNPMLPAHQCFITSEDEATWTALTAHLPSTVVPVTTPEGEKTNGILLSGWRITVLNPDATQAFDNGGVMAAPSLRKLDPTMRLRPDIAADGRISDAAAFYVDMSHGTVTALKYRPTDPDSGYYAQWTFATTDEPKLQFTSREGQSITVPLPDGASFVVNNTTSDATDKQYDYLLNFLIAEGGIPAGLYSPSARHSSHAAPLMTDAGKETMQRTLMTMKDYATTTSCSVTTYP